MEESVANRSALPLRVGAALLFLLGVFPLAAVIKWAPVISWLPAAWREWTISIIAVLGLAIILATAGADRIDAAFEDARAGLLRIPPPFFALWAGLFTFGASLFVAWYCFGGQPVAGDEMAQRFQARILLSGRTWAVAEPNMEFHNGVQTLNVDGRWFSQFPIGGAALLAIGVLFNAAWIVNPLLAGWTAANLYRFASRVGDDLTARIATLLFATSPFVLLMSGSQMNHVGALAFIMFALVGLADWVKAQDAPGMQWPAFRIGLGFAVSAAIRPYEAAAFAVVVGVFQLVVARRSPARWRSFVWLMGGAAIPMALLMYVNAQQTGHPLLFGYDALNGSAHRPGFHPDPFGVDFTPIHGLHHISSYLLLLNRSLFGGPIPSVLLVVVALALMPRATKWDYLSIGLIGILLAAYTAYWAESFFVGPRFLYAGVPFFVLFAAKMSGAITARVSRPTVARAARLILPLSVAAAWLLPAGAANYQGVWTALTVERQSNAHARMDLAAEVRDAGLEEALVIVHESWHGRIAARLRARGAPALTAESMLRELDACGLHVGLDAEDRIKRPETNDSYRRVVIRALSVGQSRLVPGTNGSTALAFVPDKPINPYCAVELEADRAGVVALDRFLVDQRFDRTGNLAGRVVFVRDLGTRNEKLLARFGDRTWYRYRPPAGPGDNAPIFIPYMSAR